MEREVSGVKDKRELWIVGIWMMEYKIIKKYNR